mgnify:CR=1 FL=1
MSTAALLRPRPVHGAADLLAAWLPGSFFYTSPRGTLLADGVHALVAAGGVTHAEAARAALADAAAAGIADPVVVGAIGFRPDGPASLVVPAVVRRAGPGAGATTPPAAPSDLDWTVTERPQGSVYVDAVRRALDLIGDDTLRKVVLARSLELSASRPVPVPTVLARLAAADPAAHAFAVDVSAPGDLATRTLLGASPELLVRRHGDDVVANPLAGSAPRSADPAEDRRRAAALRRSDKDLREHAVTVEQVAAILRRFCTDVTAPTTPQVIGTATMWHLSSVIRGRLVDRSVSSLTLAEALHPTPAICGVPTDRARDVIARLEPVDRGYYSGLVGWCDADGDGEWVVTIRCAEVCDRTVRLFAGAGVVVGSDPEAELAETRAKFDTLLRALGLSVEDLPDGTPEEDQ